MATRTHQPTMTSATPCCGPVLKPSSSCSPSKKTAQVSPPPPRMNQPFVVGPWITPAGTVPRVSSQLTRRDRWGTFLVRWGYGRHRYTVDPGLYALGSPGPSDPVLVTANYKLSFDTLRAALPGHHVWILVLDTKGINVWCAAGKGTFGTQEVINRLRTSRLKEIVSHRTVILPQLSAPGVAARYVKTQTGFTAFFGPVEARDLPAYLDAGFKATESMRRKTFPWKERLLLVPVELVHSIRWGAAVAAAFFVLGGLLHRGPFWASAWKAAYGPASALGHGILSGGVLTPLLLPWLPGRAFTTKGLITGGACAAILWFFGHLKGLQPLDTVSWVLGLLSVSAFLAMNFTGSSTYTSLSGVRREMRWAVPLEIVLFAGFVGTWLWARCLGS